MVKNKKAWLKTLEAVIGIIIIISAVLYILSANIKNNDNSDIIYEKEKYILQLISSNDSLRMYVINEDYESINRTIKAIIPSSWSFETSICDIKSICPGNNIPLDRNVYSSEVVISTSGNNYNLKKLRFFVW